MVMTIQPQTTLSELLLACDNPYPDTKDKAMELDGIVEELFKRWERGDFSRTTEPVTEEQFWKLLNRLAQNFGVPSAVEHYCAHKDASKWKGLDGAEMKFDMKNFDPDLQNKILEWVTEKSGSDQIKDEKFDKLVGVKVSDNAAKAALRRALVLESAPEAAKAAKNASGFLSIPKELWLEVEWPAIEDTWDSYQKKILSKKTPEDMGKTFCEETLFFPLNLVAKSLNKLDTWIIAKAKASKAARAAAAANGNSGQPDPSGNAPSSPASPGPQDAESTPLIEAMGLQAQLTQQLLFCEKTFGLLALKGLTDPAYAELAQQFHTAMNDDNFNLQTMNEKFPGLSDRLFAEIPFLMADPKNQNYADFIANFDAMPPEVRAMFAQQAERVANGLTPDGKTVVDLDPAKVPQVQETDKYSSTTQEVQDPNLGKGTEVSYQKEGEDKPSLTETTFVNDDTGKKTVITKFGEMELKRVYDKDAEKPSVYELSSNGNKISLDGQAHFKDMKNVPGLIATSYNGHTLETHEMAPALFAAYIGKTGALANRIDDYKADLQKQANPTSREESHEEAKPGARPEEPAPVRTPTPAEATSAPAEAAPAPAPAEHPASTPEAEPTADDLDKIFPPSPEIDARLTVSDRCAAAANIAVGSIKECLKGKQPEGTRPSLFQRPGDGSKFGYIVNLETRSFTRFEKQEGGLVKYAIYFPYSQRVIQGRIKASKETSRIRETRTEFDFSKTPPTAEKIQGKKREPATIQPGQQKDLQSHLKTSRNFFNAVCRKGLADRANADQKLLEFMSAQLTQLLAQDGNKKNTPAKDPRRDQDRSA